MRMSLKALSLYLACAASGGTIACTKPQMASGMDRYAADHPDAGLPTNEGPLAVYSSVPSHPLNQLHQLLFYSEITPSEVSGALPRELEALTDAHKPWYFRKRAGTPEDTKTFGGDVRISPVVHWTASNSQTLNHLHDSLSDGAIIQQLSPLQRQLLQWDLLSVWWRLEQKPDIPDNDLWKLANLVRVSSQPEETLRSLPSGWEHAQTQFQNRKAVDSSLEDNASASEYFTDENIFASGGNWSEISRKSTQLFVASQSLRNSRVFIKTNQQHDLQAWMDWHRKSSDKHNFQPATQIETSMVLSLMGISSELKPVATPIIDEIRFRTVYSSDNGLDVSKTTTQDGSSIWVYFIDRQQTLQNNAPTYRPISMETQSVFLEYGTEKHATYAAQCSLCHRLTNAGNQTIAGIRSLSLAAQPEIENDPSYRGRLAEAQMQIVSDRLRARLSEAKIDLQPLKINFRETIHAIP